MGVGPICYISILAYNIGFEVSGQPSTLDPIAPSCAQVSHPKVIEALYSTFNADVMCSPFKNYPPYQCTSLQPLSPLAILSQSFALTTTVIAVLLFVAALLFKARVMPEPPVTKLDSVSSEIHDGHGGDRSV